MGSLRKVEHFILFYAFTVGSGFGAERLCCTLRERTLLSGVCFIAERPED